MVWPFVPESQICMEEWLLTLKEFSNFKGSNALLGGSGEMCAALSLFTVSFFPWPLFPSPQHYKLLFRNITLARTYMAKTLMAFSWISLCITAIVQCILNFVCRLIYFLIYLENRKPTNSKAEKKEEKKKRFHRCNI